MKLLTKSLVFIVFIILFSCNFNKTSQSVNSLIDNDTIKKDSIVQKNSYIRNKNEKANKFIERIFNNSLDLNHPIIETTDWYKGINTIFVFYNKYISESLGTNVEGYIYISEDNIHYQRCKIDTYEPEGGNAKIESVFFENVDNDIEKELIVLCSWEQRLKEIAEGKIYKVYIYDNIVQFNNCKKLRYLEEKSNQFKFEFEGIQDGVELKAKYNTAKKIKNKIRTQR